MKQIDPLHNRYSGLDWQVLGKIEGLTLTDAGDVIRIQLAKILDPLNLPPGFLNKIMRSARDGILRAAQTETVRQLEHIRLVIFAPREYGTKSGCWGFFRIEKVDEEAQEYRFEYYLYLDGIP